MLIERRDVVPLSAVPACDTRESRNACRANEVKRMCLRAFSDHELPKATAICPKLPLGASRPVSAAPTA
jgi:hypothetical protein